MAAVHSNRAGWEGSVGKNWLTSHGPLILRRRRKYRQKPGVRRAYLLTPSGTITLINIIGTPAVPSRARRASIEVSPCNRPVAMTLAAD